jgi:diguanylate cyclase (GGDEF)-like protein
MGIRSGLLILTLLPSLGAALAPPVAAPPALADDALSWRAFRTFTSADGLPQNSVLALLQDHEGFIVAGTNQGLARYDGLRWHTIDLPTNGSRYAVGALGEDRDGALWIGTDAEGAWRLANGKADRVPIGPTTGVNAFLSADDGRMWVATYEALYRCGREQCETIDALKGLGARSLLVDRGDHDEDRLWVGTNGGGVVQLDDLQARQPKLTDQRITRDDGLPNNIALSLAHFAGDLWIGTGRGVARFDGTRLHVYGKDNGFPAAMVFGLQESSASDGRPLLLASLRPGGVVEIGEDGRWRLIDGRHGLPSNAAHALLLERFRQHVWVGTMTAGVARMEAQRWALFDERNGLPDRIVSGVGWTNSDSAALWIGTAGGAVQWRDGRFVPLNADPRTAQLVYDVLDSPDGSRWIAHTRGLQRWRGSELESDYTVDNSPLPAVSTDRLILRRTGGDGFEVYVASGHGLARWRPADGLQHVTDLPGSAPTEAIQGFATQAEPSDPTIDRLWLATGDGLLRLDADGWSRVELECIDRRDIVGLSVDHMNDDGLWLVTRGRLLHYGADQRCIDWPAAARLGSLNHVKLHQDQIFLFGSRGMLRLARSGPPDQDGELFGREAGLDSPEIVASAIDERGRIFAATASGLAALAVDLRPASAKHKSEPSPLRLLAAQFGEDARLLTRGTLLSPDNGSVDFSFVLLAFDREYAVRYRTRLVGLENQPRAWSTASEVSYPRLPAGNYELVIEARDADGVEATPIRFPFSVDAPLWQRPWVLLSVPLLLLAIGITLGRWRLRATRQRAAELEAVVAARTLELARANQRLEEVAVTDPLTGLKNRRYVAGAAAAYAERARAAERDQSLLVALLDVDHFKRINDAHGHDAGDAVLVEFARRLHAMAREGDVVVRWGGEEFLLLLRDVADTDAVLRRLLDGLVRDPVAIGGQLLTVGASIGAARFPPDPANPDAHSLEQVITRADAALYRAKGDGRLRAIVALQSDANSAPEYHTILPSEPVTP